MQVGVRCLTLVSKKIISIDLRIDPCNSFMGRSSVLVGEDLSQVRLKRGDFTRVRGSEI